MTKAEALREHARIERMQRNAAHTTAYMERAARSAQESPTPGKGTAKDSQAAGRI